MKAQTLAVCIGVLLFTSVAANSSECDKDWFFEYASGDLCIPRNGHVGFGKINVYTPAWYAAGVVIGGACLKSHRLCGLQKHFK